MKIKRSDKALKDAITFLEEYRRMVESRTVYMATALRHTINELAAMREVLSRTQEVEVRK